jgi:hypothetical protein
MTNYHDCEINGFSSPVTCNVEETPFISQSWRGKPINLTVILTCNGEENPFSSQSWYLVMERKTHLSHSHGNLSWREKPINLTVILTCNGEENRFISAIVFTRYHDCELNGFSSPWQVKMTVRLMGFPFHDKLPWLWDQWVFLPITMVPCNGEENPSISQSW